MYIYASVQGNDKYDTFTVLTGLGKLNVPYYSLP